jgi:tetratricopeptide (TPR) repeat protein
MAMWGIDIHFTGKMGVRTKYQTFKVAQLVVEVNQDTKSQPSSEPELDKVSHQAAVGVKLTESKAASGMSLEQIPDESALPSPPAHASTQPSIVPLEQIFDNILHEQPVIDDFIGYSSSSQSLETNVVLIALLLHTMKSHAFDDQQREKSLAYLGAVISNYRDYSVMVLALTIRSSFEFAINRKMERAMLQFDQLFKDWNSKDFSVADRLRFAHTVNLPSYIDLITILAQNYAKIACFMSAFGLYRDLGMHSKAIECLFLSGQKGQALDYVEGLPSSFKDQPSIICILGDIHKDPSYYHRAVKEAGGKYAPAFRALGGFYFATRDWEQSLGYYESAVALNDYHLTSWMRIAFIHMERGRVNEAISAYKKAVWINESEGGAWTNLALLYRRQGKTDQAFDSIQRAVALNERNWYGWYNAVIISLEHRNFSLFVKSCLKLAELDKPEEIKDFMVKKFAAIVGHLMDEAGEDAGLLRQADGLLAKFGNKNRQVFRSFGEIEAAGEVRVGRIWENSGAAGENVVEEASFGRGRQSRGERVPSACRELGGGEEATG